MLQKFVVATEWGVAEWGVAGADRVRNKVIDSTTKGTVGGITVEKVTPTTDNEQLDSK